jgi:hypothetical protein
MGEMKNEYTNSVGISEAKVLLGDVSAGKVILSMCLIKYHAIKTYEGEGV